MLKIFVFLLGIEYPLSLLTRPGQNRVYGITFSVCHRRAVFALVPRFQYSSSRSVLRSLRISFLDARLSFGQPRFQCTLSRNSPTTGFYDSVDSGRVRHRSRFLLFPATRGREKRSPTVNEHHWRRGREWMPPTFGGIFR